MTSRSRADSAGRGRDQRFERGRRAPPRVRVREQTMGEVEPEAEVVELERELLDVEVGPKLALLDRLRRDPSDAVEPRLLLLDEVLAQVARPIIELDRRAEQRAAAVPGFIPGAPLEPRR